MLKYGIIFGLILLSFLATAWFLYQKGQEKPVVYETGILFETDIIKKTVATGSIVPQKEVSLKSQVPGIVEKVYVTAGEQVKNGQKIAKIKLIPSPANINNAETSIDQLKMRVKDAEKELQRQKNINSQQIDIGAAKIALEQAETEEKRQKQLFQEGIISEQAYQQFVVDVNTRRNQLDQ
ncbi:MAG: HlyD family secretion protein, partial [Chitinophagales bacterium]